MLKYKSIVILDTMEDWTEKYRPKNLGEIVGNHQAIIELKKWADKWNRGKPKKRAVILSGNPGTGKTSSALALAKDYGWPAIELNTSDVRNATKIKNVATFGAVNETFDDKGGFVSSLKGGRKLIILDEADNLYERTKDKGKIDLSDKGGKKAIVDTIKITKQPIILIVNDYYNLIKGKGESLKSSCKLIKFYNPYSNSVFDLLKRICVMENIEADTKVLKTIAERSKGDIRSSLNDLQSLCLNKKQIDERSLNVLGYRDQKTIIFDALRNIFKNRDIQKIRESLFNLDEDPNSVLLWINENLPLEYLDINDMNRGYYSLSKADIFLGRVNRRQNYGLWSYASDLMYGGVATAKTHEYPNGKYNFPLWLREIKRSKSYRDTRDSIVKKINEICHNSKRKSRNFLSMHFTQMLRNNIDFSDKMRDRLDFTESEMKYLLGEKYSSNPKTNHCCNKKAFVKPVRNEIILSDENEKDKKEKKQQSLLDF